MADVKKTAPVQGVVSFEEENVETRLNFKPDPALGNLCMGYINDVRVELNEVPLLDEHGAESEWEYKGCKLPSIAIEFKQCKTDANPKDRFYTFRVSPVTTTKKNGEPVDEKTVVSIMQQNYNRLRHIANQFKGLKNYPNLGTCPSINYLADPKTRCEQYEAFFEYFKKLLIGKDEEKPMYKGVKLFMKLVANYKTGKYLEFPSFVGRGFVERVIEGQAPTLEFEANETVKLAKAEDRGARETQAAKATNETSGIASDEVQAIIDRYNK